MADLWLAKELTFSGTADEYLILPAGTPVEVWNKTLHARAIPAENTEWLDVELRSRKRKGGATSEIVAIVVAGYGRIVARSMVTTTRPAREGKPRFEPKPKPPSPVTAKAPAAGQQSLF